MTDRLTWRYAVTVIRGSFDEDIYDVREVFTGADGSLTWTMEPVAPGGGSLDEVMAAVEQMRQDILHGKVLDLTDPLKPNQGHVLGFPVTW